MDSFHIVVVVVVFLYYNRKYVWLFSGFRKSSLRYFKDFLWNMSEIYVDQGPCFYGYGLVALLLLGIYKISLSRCVTVYSLMNRKS
jgi:hypothetical protein